ncbi:muscle M-line assembly protein unc-89 isoform X2 [Drosophila eugracilis]|uniref:muscle M-line assembly protein unc-89 isoform X2 n=1 Tax=Drosophila eugracilis TaxID=29029 RepID=UPI0007E65966|nr:muscle M-line assembly protein unc-89 isoform X2 [Drosophila eugracilis]
MVKLGKKKVVEELSRKKRESADTKRKNGTAPESENEDKDRPGSNGDTGSSASQSTAGSSKKTLPKRKSRAAVRSASEDSDDQPLNNGNKVSSAAAAATTTAAATTSATASAAGGSSSPKKRKMSRSKATPAPAAKNGKKQEAPEVPAKEAEPVKSDEEPEYEVEAIVGKKTVKGATHFLVRWKGYTKDEDTWMPEADLHCDLLIEKFKAEEPKSAKGKAPKPAKKVGGRGRAPAGTKKTAPPADPEKEWVVERIIDFVEESGGLYRIRWKGFGAKDDTWEPESNLSCEGLIEKFKRDLITQKNVDIKELRESPKKTKRLVNECYPRTNIHNRIERSSKRAAAKNRVFYGED